MTTIDHANQLSNATFSSIETAFYYLFATPAGWTFWGVLALYVLYGILSDVADRPKPSQAAIAEAERRYKEVFGKEER